MRVLAKSLLDLVPLAIVTIIISVLASQSLDELSVNYNEIISEDLSVVNRLNDADRAIDNWKSSIDVGILTSAENADLASENFENLGAEADNLKKSLAHAINILEGKKARFFAGDSESSQQSENEPELTKSEENIKLQIDSLKFLKENSIAKIVDRSKNIQNMTQFSALFQRDLLFSMNSSLQTGLTISLEGTVKSLEISNTFQTDLNNNLDDIVDISTNVGEFPTIPVILLDINSVFQEIKSIQDALAFSFGKYMQKNDELVKELKQKIEEAKSLTTNLSKVEQGFNEEYMDKESYKNIFGEYFIGNYSTRLQAPIKNYDGFYRQFTDALLRDDQRLRKLKIEKNILFSSLSTAATTINSIIADVQQNIDAKSAQNQSLTDQRIETTWTLSIIGLIAAVAIGFLVARQTIINPMREFTTITNDIANSGDFSKRINNPGRDEIGEAGKAVNNMLEITEKAFKDIQVLFTSVSSGDLMARLPSGYKGDIEECALHIEKSLEKLSVTLKDILMDVDQIATAASQAGDAVGQVAEGAKAQVEATQDIQAKVRDSGDLRELVEDSTKKTGEAALEASKTAKKGTDETEKMVELVNEVSQNSGKIAEISSLIEEIAQQTTMLALNASIEASRAGEAGRGFSVVATEVGKLADRSSQSVKDIGSLTNDAIEKANDSVSRMDKVKSEMENINDLIKNIESMMLTVDRHTDQQKEVALAVSSAIDNLERIGESNAVSSEEITASMVELSKIAGNTREKINVFSLDNMTIDDETDEAKADIPANEDEFDLNKALKDATE